MTIIHKVGIVGAGQMGAGIAEVCARASLDVLVCETDPDRVEAAPSRISGSLGRALRKGKLTPEFHDRAIVHLAYTHDLDAMGDRDLVIARRLPSPTWVLISMRTTRSARTRVWTAPQKAMLDEVARLAKVLTPLRSRA